MIRYRISRIILASPYVDNHGVWDTLFNIYDRWYLSVRHFQESKDLQFGGRTFYIAFHPFRICFYQEAILPICVEHSLILSHDNRENHFFRQSSKCWEFCTSFVYFVSQHENFETISDLIKWNFEYLIEVMFEYCSNHEFLEMFDDTGPGKKP